MAKQVFLENHTLVVLTRFFNKNNIRKVVVRNGEEQKDFAEVVHAKWIMPDEGYDPKRWRKCSSCGRHIKLYEDYTDFAGNDNLFRIQADYCIRCGARMDGE